MESHNKIPKVSKYKLKITHTKNQETLNLVIRNNQRHQHQDDRDVKIICQRFFKSHHTNAFTNYYKYAGNKWKNRTFYQRNKRYKVEPNRNFKIKNTITEIKS